MINKKTVKIFTITILGIVGVIIFILALWLVPIFLQPPTKTLPVGSEKLISIRHENRKFMAQVIGGLAILYGLYLNNRRTKTLEDRARITEEGHITDRFTKAVEQLGNETLAVKLGGIYSLARIANDSEKDYWTVMEVLTAYVRSNVPFGLLDGSQNGEKTLSDNTSQKNTHIDIQAILTIIGQRKWIEKEPKGASLDLSNTYLLRANLQGVKLIGVNLQNVNLQGANLRRASLQRVKLIGARLIGVDLRGANLENANLRRAYLERARLEEANLWKAKLIRANLLGAYLQGTNLESANLERACLKEANLRGTNLEKAKQLTMTQLSEAKTLYKAKLDNTLLEEIKTDTENKERWEALFRKPKYD